MNDIVFEIANSRLNKKNNVRKDKLLLWRGMKQIPL